MNKPITVAYEDCKKNIVDVVNQSGLPAFVIESILKDSLLEVRDIVRRQYEKDKKDYEAALENEQESLPHIASEDAEVVS